MTFTDDQLDSLAHHLRVAAERYDADATSNAIVNHAPRLAEQFTRQAAECRELADRIENRRTDTCGLCGATFSYSHTCDGGSDTRETIAAHVADIFVPGRCETVETSTGNQPQMRRCIHVGNHSGAHTFGQWFSTERNAAGAHVVPTVKRCGHCGGTHPAGQSCDCFDNNCQ